MEEKLIKVDFDGECPTVFARDIFDFLEIKCDYKMWVKQKVECDFWKRGDFFIFRDNCVEGYERKIYLFTLSMAKEVCLLGFSEKARKCREYLSYCEELWNSPEKVKERALLIAQKRIERAERRINDLLEENEELRRQS
jgi:phage anti-repressor protein